MTRLIIAILLVAFVPTLGFTQERVRVTELLAYIQVCAQNSDIDISANMVGSIESAFTDGERLNGEI